MAMSGEATRDGGLRVLVVDDQEDVRRSLSMILQYFGHEVETAEDGKKGFVAIGKGINGGRPYDIVLTDLQMPNMDGLELIRRAARTYEGQCPACYLMTGTPNDLLGRESELGELRHLGSVLLKPFDIERLEELLRSYAAGRTGYAPLANRPQRS